jgi:chaperone required for assembly of F1-ATPase
MKRFYKEVTVSAAPFQILLDGRPVKTPMKAALTLPTTALAEAVAEEWRGQGDDIAPQSMVLTKLANTAIDRVAPLQDAVAGQVMRYVNDLLCYRADHPAALVARQSGEWDPLLAWAAACYGAHLQTRTGPVHFDQPEEAVAVLRQAVAAYDPFPLTALATAAPILGSLVLTLALAEGRLNAEAAFALSQLDERFQAEHWGEDQEATDRAAALLVELKAVEKFLRLALAP